MRRLLLAITILWAAFAPSASAQYLGGHPWGIAWRCINTDTLRLIFPAGMEEQAFKVASLIHYEARQNSQSIGGRVPKANLIFQNQTVEPNGFVTLLPYRAEFFTTPPQDIQMLGSTDWLTVLGIHEYRHVLQYYNQRRAFVKAFYWLNGETGWAIGSNLLFPPWYFEGDAVYTETKLSNQGRGRMPYFFAPLWSMAEEGKRYPYKKLRNGSYKDILPNHYAYGYLMCSYLNDRYGEESLIDVTKHTTRLRSVFFPFAASLKKVVGSRPSSIYNQAFTSMEREWNLQKDQRNVVEGEQISHIKKDGYRSYESPVFIDSNRVVAILTRLNEIKTVVEINPQTGQEKELFKLGAMFSDKLQATAGKIVWSEVYPDMRWQNRSYSAIKLYQMSNGKTMTIGDKDKLFAPSLSPDGTKIAAVRISTNQQYELVIFSAIDGTVHAALPNKGDLSIYTPTWSTSSSIVFIGGKDNRLSIFEQGIGDGEAKRLMPYTSHTIANPTCNSSKIYFEGSFDGQDNLYAIAATGGTPEQLTQATIGGYQPTALGNKLVYSSYSISGSKLRLLDNPTPLSPTNELTEPRTQHLPGAGASINAATSALVDSIPSRSWNTSSYSPAAHLVNIHSWGFVANGSYLGANVASQDVLSKLSIIASWMYSEKDESNYFSGAFLWGGWYPYIGASFTKIVDRNPYSGFFDNYKFDEQVLNASMDIPFNLSRGYHNTSVTLLASYGYHSISWKKPFVGTNELHTYTVGLNVSNLRSKALQQINPRFGQVLKVEYKNAFAGSFSKESFKGNATLLLPGAAKTHSIAINGNMGWETNTAAYYFYDTTQISRGYSIFPVSRYRKATADYSLPICYPDWGANGWFFLKRIRLTAFYDYTRAKDDFGLRRWNSYASAGIEAIFDTKLFNLIEMPIGIRHSILFNTDPGDSGRKDNMELFIKVASF
jgi:hypothetical protein